MSYPLVVLYHDNCMDGALAAWIVKNHEPDAEFIPVDYGSRFTKLASDLKQSNVLILDFAISPDDLLTLANNNYSVRLIDHHTTSLKLINFNSYPNVTVHVDTSFCGAELVGKVLYSSSPSKVTSPWFLPYIRARDLWLEDELLPPHYESVMAFIRRLPYTIESIVHLNQLMYEDIRQVGDVILETMNSYVTKIVADAKITLFHNTYSLVVCTPRHIASDVLNRLLMTNQYVAIAIGWTVDKDSDIRVELRSRKGGVDVSEIAKSHGGGGHTNAAGFKLKLSELSTILGEPIDHNDRTRLGEYLYGKLVDNLYEDSSWCISSYATIDDLYNYVDDLRPGIDTDLISQLHICEALGPYVLAGKLTIIRLGFRNKVSNSSANIAYGFDSRETLREEYKLRQLSKRHNT